MSRFYTLFLPMAALLAISIKPNVGCAQTWVNGQPASFVTGQPGFNSNAANVNATGLNIGVSVAVDPATGKVFVADLENNRVLRYPSVAALSNGAAAEAVLGQPDFTTNAISYDIPATPTTFCQPFGLAVDAAGNLWVADELNARVLRFANAATVASGAAASGVLGWPDFVSNPVTNGGTIEPPTAASFYHPDAVFCKGTTLWVADGGNNRILRFDNAASKANGANADALWGAPTFNTEFDAQEGTAEFFLWSPGQIYVDGSDNLWVADGYNNRVMMFPNASTGSNVSTTLYGVSATLVLGQTGFYTNSTGLTASTMNSPDGIYGDGAGNIYVGEFGNSRILVFKNAASLSNGAAASYVLGQPDFVSAGIGDAANQLDAAAYLFVPTSNAYLMAGDGFNNRVLTFVPPVPLPLLLTGFTGRLQTNGQALLQWQVSGQDEAAGGGDTVALEYSTIDTTGFTDVLSTQAVKPAVSNYSYVQVSPVKGVNYYRVRLTAASGTVTYSQVVTINVGDGVKGLSIYPNPASSEVVLMLPGAGTAQIEVYNSVGGLMQKLSAAGATTLSVGGWARGEYMVKVVQAGVVSTASFIKL